MFNVVHNCKNLGALVQVGIRDLSEMEMNEMHANEKIKTHFDWNLKKATFLGRNLGRHLRQNHQRCH